jgi:hypothetical protein
MDTTLTITDVTGPFREPRESVFSFDYSIQRPTWATPFAVRVKVAVIEELDVVKNKIMGTVGGTPGQQMLLNRLLTRHIADQKLRIGDSEGMLSERRDVLIAPFVGHLAYLFPKLDGWVQAEQASIREEIRKVVGL